MAKVQIGILKGKEKKFSFELNNLTRHSAILGSTGSGKTVMAKILLEEAMRKGIPIIAIDPKGDIGGLGISDKEFDFRPFVSNSIIRAESVAKKYVTGLKSHGINLSNAKELSKTNTKIYTPKSNVGKSLSLIPDLTSPKNFREIAKENPNLVAEFIEPLSASILQLSGVKGVLKDKAQSLVSEIILSNWIKQVDLDFSKIIEEVIEPKFQTIGSLTVEEFLNVKQRKQIAASLNLLLSSPSRKAMHDGEKINISKFFRPNNLSIIDLRFLSNIDEKQFVAEQIFQEIYKFLIKKGGSQRLKYILYIDELAGLLPPPPASPPSKKLLELLIRQARAFGLGIIIATQSPGDIDYRIFGNIGTRFVGKLRTENDVEKVAIAANLKPSILKPDVAKLNTGEFVFNDAAKNTYKIIIARWPFTYHAGPLKNKKIKWVNHKDTIPEKQGKLNIKIRNSPKNKFKSHIVKTKSVIKSVSVNKNKKKEKSKPKLFSEKEKSTILNKLIRQVKSKADKTQLKIALSDNKMFAPHLRIVVESKPIKGVDFELQGPFVFDLTSKSFPIGNYLRNIKWSTFMKNDIEIIKPKASIKKAFEHALSESKKELRKKVFQSTIISSRSVDKAYVENRNKLYLQSQSKGKIELLKNKYDKKIKIVEEKIAKNKKKISSYNIKVKSEKAKRAVKRIIGNKRLAKTTKEIKEYEKRIGKIKKENIRLKNRIAKEKKERDKKIEKTKDKLFVKAYTSIRSYTYNPKKSDLIIHATILLVPQRKTAR